MLDGIMLLWFAEVVASFVFVAPAPTTTPATLTLSAHQGTVLHPKVITHLLSARPPRRAGEIWP